MIAKLTGAVDSVGDGHVVIDVGGIGYLVFCATRTLARLPAPGGSASLLVETHVREDHIHLYGFADEAERAWFRLLTTVQGVGARIGLAILSVLGPDDLARAIAVQDKAAVARANGVGAKLAARIVAELKDKVPGLDALPGTVAATGVPAANGAASDAVSALVNLGYRRLDAFGAVTNAQKNLGPNAAAAELIRAGLKELGAGGRA
ncbi:MAG TPA: Holliday junction branch migration protein RuvA [Alphaproteobacteria bacterium]|nr:Holliday junction branch migration protein RuvA [Alphaproteobacteria bacterium]